MYWKIWNNCFFEAKKKTKLISGNNIWDTNSFLVTIFETPLSFPVTIFGIHFLFRYPYLRPPFLFRYLRFQIPYSFPVPSFQIPTITRILWNIWFKNLFKLSGTWDLSHSYQCSELFNILKVSFWCESPFKWTQHNAAEPGQEI